MEKGWSMKIVLSWQQGVVCRTDPEGKGIPMQKNVSNVSTATTQNLRNCRDRIELLRKRVNLLAGKDKAMMTMYLDNGNTFYQMGKMLEVNEVTVARKIRRIIGRLTDGRYMICLSNKGKFTPMEMNIAKDHFLLGLSIRKISLKRELSYYLVRARLNRIKEFVEIASRDQVKRV